MPITRSGSQRTGRRLSPTPELPLPGPRATLHDLHIFDSDAQTRRIEGLHVTNCITNHDMIEIIIVVPPRGYWRLQNKNGHRLLRDGSQVQCGNYFIIVADFTIELTDEDALPRATTFTDAARHRDRGCVITKEAQDELLIQAGLWPGFEAAHVFPLAYSALWAGQGFNAAIVTPGSDGDNINSVQNGMLLRADLHQLFDTYPFSICRKDNYKIVCFMRYTKDIAGTYLSPEFLSHPQRPPDVLFDWHFRQAVLSNMKAGGEQPVFEHGFLPGGDMVGQILRGPRPEDRMEFELFMRLANLQS
ncbi:hypothetical protein FQN55_005864 [Onygenales sp. PD_40]|nr:hypothetical protein FQN55_005864 [Onygenales sp. PD_40]